LGEREKARDCFKRAMEIYEALNNRAEADKARENMERLA
jgi:rubrerythrin